MNARRPRVIAHRGASMIAPENTMLAFRYAIEAGAEMIETDARLTSDGEVVLIHDADLRRTTSCSGSVSGVLASELAVCDAGHWFTGGAEQRYPFRGLGLDVPRLADLLNLVGAVNSTVFVNIELKNLPNEIDYDPTNRIATRTVTLVLDLGVVERVLVSSFNLDAIDRVKELESPVKTACVCGPGADLHARIGNVRARGHDAIHPHHSSIGVGDGARQIVDAMHGAGLEVNVWTVNDDQRMLEVAQAGVDGIITDNPERLRHLLEGGVTGE